MPDLFKTFTTCVWAVFMVLGLFFLVGCGKKAPPIAPRQQAVAVVTDLTAQYHKGDVVLTWHHPPSPAAVTGYLVYKAPQEGDGSGCKGCPILFEKVESLPLDPENRTTRHELSWSQAVAGGFQYTFKVVPVLSSGARGPDSNFVVVKAFQ